MQTRARTAQNLEGGIRLQSVLPQNSKRVQDRAWSLIIRQMETFCGKMGCLLIIFLIRLSVVSNHCVLFNRFILLKNLLVLLIFFLQRTFFDRNIRQFLIEILDTLRGMLEACWKDGDIFSDLKSSSARV